MRVCCELSQEVLLMSDRDREAASGFCAAQYPRLVGSLTLYVGDRAVAQELAQEALLRAFRRWDRVERLDAPSAWVWRVAINLANSHFRRRRAERRASDRLHASGSPATDDRDHAWGLAVRQAVADLPQRQRTALILRYYLDLSVGEAARRMDASPDAVRSLTKRAMAALREEFVPDVAALEADDG